MRQITFRLSPGSDLKKEILEQAKLVNAGVVLSAVGSLRVAKIRMAGAKPEKEDVRQYEGPLEIVSITGTISKEGCHIHLSVSDAEGRVFGGHLKEGCVVETTAEVALGAFDNVVYRRVLDPKTGFEELKPE